MTIKLPKPCYMAISYDGETPYSFPFEEDCELLDLEVKRRGGTASKLKIYTEAQLKQAIKDALEVAAITAWNHYMGTCKKNGLPAAEFGYWMACDDIRKLKDQL